MKNEGCLNILSLKSKMTCRKGGIFMRQWLRGSLFFFIVFPQISFSQGGHAPADGSPFQWASPIQINEIPQFPDQGPDARGALPGTYGSQFPRLVKTGDQSWLAVYTIYRNNGYTKTPNGGTELEIAETIDNGLSWRTIATLTDPGRDLDNGQLVQLRDGSIILAYRSVIWQTSYRIQTSKSTDGGHTWTFQSTIDSNEGRPGELGHPDRGVYEPFMMLLDDQLAVMYASEKYALANPAFSQVISMKISGDNGDSWGEETFPVRDRKNSRSRPGMPVWAQLQSGSFALVYELCETDGCNVWIKTTADWRNWGESMGQRVPHQLGAPFIFQLTDGRLLLTSNSFEFSISRDFGKTWYLNDTNPWKSKVEANNKWPSLYQFDEKRIAIVASQGRKEGGTTIQLRYGEFENFERPQIEDGKTYTISAVHSGQNLDVSRGTIDNGDFIQQWPANGLDPQKWILTKQLDGSYQMRNVQSRKLLEVARDQKEPGARVQQWQDTGCACQTWYLEYWGSGSYGIRAKHSGLYLDVAGGNLAAGAKLQQWNNIGTRPQIWKIKRAD